MSYTRIVKGDIRIRRGMLERQLAAMDTIPWNDDGVSRRERTLSFPINDIVLFVDEYEFYCADCKRQDFRVFMVHDHIWREYGNGTGMLCPQCLGKRMGRALKKEDLNDAPCNELWYSDENLLK